MPFRRMNDHPRWLVNDGNRLVFVDNIERNRLRERRIDARRHAHFDAIANRQPMRRFLLRAVNGGQAVVDGSPNPSAAHSCNRCRQIGVEPLAARSIIDDERKKFR